MTSNKYLDRRLILAGVLINKDNLMPEQQLIANRYAVIDLIGQGGMGTVYRATDTSTQEIVAVKALKSETIRRDPEIVQRFEREGDTLRKLNHPNIVKMFETLEDQQQHYIVMEYVTGGSLEDELNNDRQMPVSQVLEIALDLSDALTRAHRLNIIHRDLKPANILLADDGSPRLTDFGVAHVGDLPRVTETGTIVGTVAYISPEGLNGDALDARADIWSFGVLLFEMLTGELPFRGAKLGEMVVSVLQSPPPDIEQLRPDIPVALADLIYRMLEKDRNERIPSVRRVGAELETILQNDSWSGTPMLLIPRAIFEETDEVMPLTSSTTPPIRHNLPRQTTPFIGRENELDELTRLLSQQDVRLVTTLGPGGMGKTRLAQAVGEVVFDRLQCGVLLIELAHLESGADIVPAIADAAGLQFTEETPPVEQLFDYLSEKRLLLILDNFEHILDGVDLVNEILLAAPDIKVLATSRQRLNLTGETVFAITGMNFPDWETPEDAMEYSAVKLFVQSARRARPDFELDVEQLPLVAQICRLVQGMPLGVILAAAWIDTLSLDEIAEEIAQSMDFLKTEMRDVPERHRSVRAVFEYSWNLLDENEKEILRKLPVFRGGFERDAVQKLTGASLRMLTGLVSKSLLRRTPEGRYEIHELLRQYAEDYLRATPDEFSRLRHAHSTYYLSFLAKRKKLFTTPRAKQALREIDAELDNIRAAMWTAIEMADCGDTQNVFSALTIYYELRGRLNRGEQLFNQLEHTMREMGFTDDSLLLWQIRGRLAWLQGRMGYYEQSTALAEDALEVFRSLDDKGEILTNLMTLSYSEMMLGHYDNAEVMASEALKVAAEIEAEYEQLANSGTLAYIAFLRGDYQDARQIYEEKFLNTAIETTLARATGLNNLGEVLREMGDYDRAQEMYEEAHSIFRDFDNLRGCAFTLNNLGGIYFRKGDYALAEENYRASYKINKEIGDRIGMIDTLGALGVLEYVAGNQEAAEQHLEESYAIIQQTGNTFYAGNIMAGLATIAFNNGDYERTLRLGNDIRKITEETEFSHVLALSQNITGFAHIGLGTHDTAQELFLASLKMPRDTTPVSRYAHAIAGLAYLMVINGNYAYGLDLLFAIAADTSPGEMFLLIVRHHAKRLLTELRTQVPREVYVIAEQRSQHRTIEDMAAEIVASVG